MKSSIFNIKILSFSNGHEMKKFECSVNLTFEIYCRDLVTSFYSSKNKFVCLEFSEGPSQIYEIIYIQYKNIFIFKTAMKWKTLRAWSI